MNRAGNAQWSLVLGTYLSCRVLCLQRHRTNHLRTAHASVLGYKGQLCSVSCGMEDFYIPGGGAEPAQTPGSPSTQPLIARSIL